LKRNDWYVIGIYLLLLFGGALLAFVLSELYGFDIITTTVYINVIGFLLAALIILWIMRRGLRTERIHHPITFGRLIGWVALGLVMAWIAQTLAAVFEMYVLGVNEESANTQLIVEISRMNPIFILVPAIIGPILEELIFRKILFGAFYRKMNFFFAAILSSLLFAVAHMEFTHLLVYAAMGFVFAYLYVKTKRIIVPMLVHMALNSVAVLGQLILDPAYFEQMQTKTQCIMLLFGG
jgi:membrane protease YdiL (CAAX protease family)